MGLQNFGGSGGGGGVTSIDGINGSVTLVQGTGITIQDNTPSAGDITISSTGGGNAPGGVQYDVQLNDGSGGFAGSNDLNFQGGYLTINGDSGYGQLQWLNSPASTGYAGSGINGTATPIIVGALNGDLSIWSSQAMNFSTDTGNTNMLQINTDGSITIADLGGSGTQMVTANNAGVLSVQSIPIGTLWTEITTSTVALAVENGYVMNNASQVVGALPATAVFGSEIRIVGKGAGGWKIAQNSGQTIHFGNQNTTTGAAGSIASQNVFDCLDLLCITANTDWVAHSSQGNLTVI